MALILPRSVFLHVPKTGGVWCRAVIRRAGLPHRETGFRRERAAARMHHDLRRVEREADGRFLFAFVRDPLDWWRSYWCYRMRTGWRDHAIDNVCRADTFESFMANVLKHRPGWCSAMYRRFVGPRRRPIHFVGRYESLVDEFVLALSLAGERFDETTVRRTPPENVSDYSRWPAEYTPELRAAVRQAEQDAIDRFDY